MKGDYNFYAALNEAENDCCASSAPKSEAFQTLIPCMLAAARFARSHQPAKRSVTRVIDQANEDQKPAWLLCSINEAVITGISTLESDS